MSDTARLHAERQKRFDDVVALRKPDRVPIIPMVDVFPVRHYGLNMSEVIGNLDLLAETWLRYHRDFQPDMGDNPFVINGFFSIAGPLDLTTLKWAGRGLHSNAGYQFLEKEMMPAEDYDRFLFDPTDYMLRKILPQVYGVLAPFAKLPPVNSHFYFFDIYNWAFLADPAFAEAGRAMAEASRAATEALNSMGAYLKTLAGEGYPPSLGGITEAPFDILGDYLRGTIGVLTDMRRRPKKVLAACEKILPIMLEAGLTKCRASGVPVCFIPLHKCLDTFMSQEQFEAFYWPTLRDLILALIAENIVPYVLIEGVCDNRLPVMIRDIPAGKAIYHLENSNIFKARELARDKVCLRGNVPASLLWGGTPDDIRQYCKKLIEVVGADGGFILDVAVNLTDAKPENVKALFESGREYGVY